MISKRYQQKNYYMEAIGFAITTKIVSYCSNLLLLHSFFGTQRNNACCAVTAEFRVHFLFISIIIDVDIIGFGYCNSAKKLSDLSLTIVHSSAIYIYL